MEEMHHSPDEFVDYLSYAFVVITTFLAVKENASQETDDPPPDPEDLFSVLVSVKSFIKFLSSHVISTTTIACAFPNSQRRWCLID